MKVSGLHIEPTNICTLKCPRCARTTFIEKFKQKSWQNSNLNFDDLTKFLDIPLKDVLITLCGNYGDPIYYDDLFEMLRYFKQQQANIQLITNGSYKKIDWWSNLVSLLDENDKITFSIDGVPENFTKYRINGDWESIYHGLTVVANSKVKSVWKYIPFKYNIDSISQAKQLCSDIGIKQFELSRSDRWEGLDDPYKPLDDNFNGARNEKIILWKNKSERNIEIDALCMNGDQHFITSDGFYTPCCFVNDWRFYYKSKFYKNKNLYDIKKTTMSNLLNQEQSFFDNIELDKPEFCTFNCPKVNTNE